MPATPTKPYAVRLDGRAAAGVEQLADRLGMTRSDFLAGIVDQALVGYDLMTVGEARDRRAARAGPRKGKRARPRWAPPPAEQHLA